MPSQGGEAWAFNTMVKAGPNNASYNEDDIEEEKMRKWTNGKAIRISGPREEKEEIQEERITAIESEGSGTMPNRPVTGTVWQEYRSEGSGGEDIKPLGRRKGKWRIGDGTRIWAVCRLGL